LKKASILTSSASEFYFHLAQICCQRGAGLRYLFQLSLENFISIAGSAGSRCHTLLLARLVLPTTAPSNSPFRLCPHHKMVKRTLSATIHLAKAPFPPTSRCHSRRLHHRRCRSASPRIYVYMYELVPWYTGPPAGPSFVIRARTK